MQKLLFNIFRNWWWLLVLSTTIAGLAGYWVNAQQTRKYEAQARLIVGPGIESASPDLSALRAGTELMATYAELVVTTPVLQEVINDLGLDTSPKGLRSRLTVRTSTGTQVMTIRVEDTDPKQAVAVVNAVAEKLVELSPSGAGSPEAQLRIKMRSHADRLEQSIAASEETLSTLETALHNSRKEEQQLLIMGQISDERNRLYDSQNTLANLYASLQKSSTNQVKVIEPATNPALIDSQLRIKVWIGALAGLVLALIIAFSFEQLNNRIETVQDLAQAVDAPVLGEIPAHTSWPGAKPGQVIIQAKPESRVAESYRILGTKLLFSNGSHILRSIIIVGSHPNHDPGEIAANFALALAQAGKRVILVDANLRNPSIGRRLGLDDQDGLTSLFSDPSKELTAVMVERNPNLSVLPSGPASPNPFELIASHNMISLIRDLESRADMVIIAAPPLMLYAESLILASHVGGVVFIVRKGETTQKGVHEVIENLRVLRTHIVGTIFDQRNYRGARWFLRPGLRSLWKVMENQKVRGAGSST